MRFAFYGRVSTEDQQDPDASRNWQLARARALVERHGEIVVEFFDVGQSRSIPWKRRPEAARLLEVLKRQDRGFEAVVVGEPQRAFYCNQYGLTFPVFAHYGVGLWVPEVGGAVDPESEAHDLVMSVFGGMSKGERTRIKVRVRSAMAAQAQVEGRYLGGRPPYGYRLADAGPHPNPAKAGDGKRLHRLEPDPKTAPVVQRIFHEYLSGIGVFAIAQRLTADGIPCPSAYDRGRNQHRSGVAWSKSAVRTILTNPRYTGHEVWNKQRKQESLIDVEDVGLGHRTRLAWNPRDSWVFSDQQVHAALISRETFEQVRARLASRGPRSTGRVPERKKHPYALKGLLFHESCGRRMQGNWIRERAHYRCRYPNEYALANRLDHPLTVHLREDVLLEPLDTWLAQVFAPGKIERSLTEMEESQPDHAPAGAETRRALAECDRKLARHQAALEAGTDPALVAKWTRQVQREKAVLEAQLAASDARTGADRRMTAAEIRQLVDAMGGLLQVLRDADPGDKLEVYRQLGLKLTYNETTRMVVAESQPRPSVCAVVVSEGGVAH
ncbi:recombinase family protein [Amycolatopsis thermoflava]|uniref:DNA invertase Pin-like site-specific DNA recombinase n=1 Tax=Amycolatopsis thermoflava TaxID=84480 RepID=A0A3N2G6B9_9PSEU|nr:recombinase family protein [Amycolatopsis thermoflava]ROS32182.1 DNA invertase Pin-like site-specific DNA recombinase [Amycolatopsis thermoflava]